MILESIILSGLYDLAKFGGKLFTTKFYSDFAKARDYAASRVATRYPQIFPSRNFAEHVFRLEDEEVKNEVKMIAWEDENLSPLDRLRKKGKTLSKIFLIGGEIMVGHIFWQDETNLKLNTGDAKLTIPKSDIKKRLNFK